jgi:hypothetical protein
VVGSPQATQTIKKGLLIELYAPLKGGLVFSEVISVVKEKISMNLLIAVQ